MSGNRVFSKANATKYALVHRPQDDPLINDENAPSQIFTEISRRAGPSGEHGVHKSKVKYRGDLEEEFSRSGEAIPVNDEVAAEHGVRFNDGYNYLQHLRDLGQSGGEAAWIEAQPQGRGKQKVMQSLDDALRESHLGDSDDSRSQGGMNLLSGLGGRAQPGWQRYQEQQDVPDDIAGFQPDMDPRLREALEALDDEAYVDEDQDLFDELAQGGEELDREEWEAMGFEDEDGWESDDTAKAANDDPESKVMSRDVLGHADVSREDEAFEGPPPVDEHGDGDFFEAFAKSKAEKQTSAPVGSRKPPPAPSAAFTTDTAATGRRKKRKGALTSSTGFSMTSSALARTEAMSTLDSQFDRVLDSYMDDIGEDEEVLDDNVSAVTGMSRATGASKMSFASRTEADDEAPPLVANGAFTSAMDEYLIGNGKKGKRVKRGGKQAFWGQQNGMDQLDEIRKGLGPARMPSVAKGVGV